MCALCTICCVIVQDCDGDRVRDVPGHRRHQRCPRLVVEISSGRAGNLRGHLPDDNTRRHGCCRLLLPQLLHPLRDGAGRLRHHLMVSDPSIVTRAVRGCRCYGHIQRQAPGCCVVACRIVPVIVFVLLLHAAVEESDCDKIHKGVYAGAGVLVLVSTVLGITSYLMLRTRPEPTPPIVVPMVIAFQPVYPNPLLVPVPVQAPPPNQAFAHPATLPPQGGWYGQAPNQQFAAPAPAQGYGWQAPNQQHFPCAGVVP